MLSVVDRAIDLRMVATVVIGDTRSFDPAPATWFEERDIRIIRLEGPGCFERFQAWALHHAAEWSAIVG